MTATQTYKILFVCMGNICRSPAGEAVMRKLVEDEGLEDQIHCDSAGTISFHSGDPPDKRMHQAAANRGIQTGGQARQVRVGDFETFDRVLAMDRDNLRDLLALAKTESHRKRIRPFCDYCDEHDNRDVPDPYYGGAQGFELVLDLLEDGCNQLLDEAKAELGLR